MGADVIYPVVTEAMCHVLPALATFALRRFLRHLLVKT